MNETWIEPAIAILGLAGITLLTRAFFMIPERDLPMPDWLRRGLTDAPLGVLADGGTVLAGSGYGGRRNACQRRHIPNGYGHRNAPLRRR